MIYILFFLILTFYILTHSAESLYYAFHGLTLWYNKMVPALLPFMILSGTLIRMHLTERVVLLFHPVLKKIFRCNPNVSYGILMGFLCGFPMGAKVASDLLRQDKITETEARYLLAFCNNIGPVYFCSFVIPVLKVNNIPFAIAVMYGIPFVYGILLRYTLYRKRMDQCLLSYTGCLKRKKTDVRLLSALDDAIRSGISSISMLCGYMILFNLLNILPHFWLPSLGKYIAPLLEITGGITLNSYASPVYILILLPFGGLSCIAQTNSMIADTPLSIKEYTIHKLILTGLTSLFYY